jgi:Tol biopolymer transport system component
MNPQIQPIAHYRITAKLGEGGMGEVYRATDTKLGREVAIKVLPESLGRDAGRMARFEREAQVLASLNHPNIAQIYGVEDRALVMELVEGESPAGPLPVDESLRIALQMAEALEYAHEKGIIHRDLKPANIKITPDGAVKLLDFGLAKAFATDREAPAHRENSPTLTIGATEVGVILGTASYMSPEQAAAKPVDRRADIWSYGVVLWELLTGERLFAAETISHTLADVLRAPINFGKLPKETPGAIRILLERCLDRNVKSRLRDIGEARVAIQRYLADPTATVEQREAAPSAGIRWKYSLFGALLVAVLIAGLFGWYRFRQAVPTRLVSQFRIQAPPETRLTNVYGSTAASPDGRYIVFGAIRGAERPLLWLRPVDSVDARPLPGTDGANFPFWSPDSKSIAFISADNKLKRLDLGSGGPLALCDAPQSIVAPNGGTWNRDGVILFAGAEGLRRVSAASGGEAVLLTRANPSHGETAHGYPQFLPDGKHFLYFIQSSDAAIEGTYAGSMDRPEERVPIVKGDTKAVYVQPALGSSYLLYLRGRTLLAQPFNAEKLRLEGQPVQVAQDIAINGLRRAAFWVSDGGVLIYRMGTFLAADMVWYSRDGKAGVPLQPIQAGALRLSPDGSRVAFARSSDSSSSNLWVLEFSRGFVTRLTFGSYGDLDPVWSPDGRQVAFTSSRGGGQIYRKNADGGGVEEQLTKGPNQKRATDWSRDGKFLLYSEENPRTLGDLWVMPLDGDRKPVPFLETESSEERGQFSPDGRWIAYQSDESGVLEVYIRGFPSSSRKWQVSIKGGSSPRWRADSKELFYISRDRKIMAVAVRTTSTTVQLDNPRELFPASVTFQGATAPYDVSADGRRFLLALESDDRANYASLTVVTNWDPALSK